MDSPAFPSSEVTLPSPEPPITPYATPDDTPRKLTNEVVPTSPPTYRTSMRDKAAVAKILLQDFAEDIGYTVTKKKRKKKKK